MPTSISRLNKSLSLKCAHRILMHIEALMALSAAGLYMLDAAAPNILTILRTDQRFSDDKGVICPRIINWQTAYAAVVSAKHRATLLRPHATTHSVPTAVGFFDAVRELLTLYDAHDGAARLLIDAMKSYSMLGESLAAAQEPSTMAERREDKPAEEALASPADSGYGSGPPTPAQEEKAPNSSPAVRTNSNSASLPLRPALVKSTPQIAPGVCVATLKAWHQALTRRHSALARVKDDDAALEHMRHSVQLKDITIKAWRSIGGRTEGVQSECVGWDEPLGMWEGGIDVWEGEREALCG